MPRFRRASEPPAFRLTSGDAEIVRQVARHRLLRSTHIAALVGRSLDRTNDRLKLLFHAGYLDRPRAQLDYYPTSGSDRMVYALANRGARLLRERDGISFANVEWSRKNREAGRPFIEHQVEIVNFQVALERAVRDHTDLRLIPAADMIAACGPAQQAARDAFTLHAKLSHRGKIREIGVIPDLVFGLQLGDRPRRNFMVEIDRGTMPVSRSDPHQTSFERKMRVYLAAHAAEQHEQKYGWKNFRVLTVTTDRRRMQTMTKASQQLRVPRRLGPSLFLFATFNDLRATTALAHDWQDGNGRLVDLI